MSDIKRGHSSEVVTNLRSDYKQCQEPILRSTVSATKYQPQDTALAVKRFPKTQWKANLSKSHLGLLIEGIKQL